MNARGFTLIELLVSVGIFAFMTALLVAKYGNFNQSVLLTNLAYDVAITLRTAQTYGLSVKRAKASASPTTLSTFKTAYGVNFNSSSSVTCSTYNSSRFAMFSDTDLNGSFGCSESVVSTYNLKRGATITELCVGVPGVCPDEVSRLDITYKRPDPEAIICVNGQTSNCTAVYAEIRLTDPSGAYRRIGVHKNGQIEVKD